MPKSRNRDTRPLGHWLRNSGDLPDVTARARKLAELRERIQRMLPAGISEHLSLANLRGSEAIFVADSPVFQQRAHYLQSELKRIVERCLERPVTRVRILVAPRSGPSAPQRWDTRVSEDIAPALASAARGVAHEGMKSALNRLSETARQLRRDESEGNEPE